MGRFLLFLVGSLLTSLATAGPTPVYLPVLGPGPLRFRAPPPPPGDRPVLPPLPKGDEVPIVKEEPVMPYLVPDLSTLLTPPAPLALPPPVLDEPAPTVIKASSPVLAPSATTTISGPVVESDSGNLLTPQMLVQFFRSQAGRTNGTGTILAVPAFTPPPPPTPPPSSTATFSTP